MKNGLCTASGSDFLMTMVKIMVAASVVMTTKWMEHLTNCKVLFGVQSALRDQCTGREIPMKFQMLYATETDLEKTKKKKMKPVGCNMSRNFRVCQGRSTSLGQTDIAHGTSREARVI